MTRSLYVLMWKHAVARKRKFILTAVDFLSPILFFALLYSIKTILVPTPRSGTEDGTVLRTEPINMSDNEPLGLEHHIMHSTILYHPDSDVTNQLMTEVGELLYLKRLHNIPEQTNSNINGYVPYNNDTEMIGFTSTMKPGDAVVIFHDLDSGGLLEKLNYTIRMKDDLQTRTYEPEDNTPDSHTMYGLDYLTFMRIQWAIDRSYISMRSGYPVNQTVQIQEFPYYRTYHNTMLSIVSKILEVLSWLSLLLVFVDLMYRLLAERASGIQELIKMVGVNPYTLAVSHYLNVLPSGSVFSIGGTIILKAIIPTTNPFYIFFMLILYFNTVISLAFACSYLVKSTEYGATLAVISYGLLWMPLRFVSGYNLPYLVGLLTGLLPHVPMSWFWKEICFLEMSGSGVKITNMFSTNLKNNQSVFASYVFLMLQCLIYFGLAAYLSLVRPGQYGQARPWNFMFKKKMEHTIAKVVNETHRSERRGSKSNQVSPTNSIDIDASDKAFWKRRKTCQSKVEGDKDSIDLIQRDDHYFEDPPDGMTVGIFVDNVSKEYHQNTALNNVTLKVFEGEITVLVGHNGAGKTTLMSIITGMTSPTSGKVFVHGYDTTTQAKEVRKRIGLCPQHNMFFMDLTLQEHIMFFTMLKQGTYKDAQVSSRKLAAQLHLEHKLGSLCGALSGGMKRRAQLACALAGDADVLILDEPTSGLDVESRRELWDLLLSLRGARTVLLSTHFMEEADVLGDRVVALHRGELRCFATTMYLKKAVGDGYRLTLTTIGAPNEEAINEKVHEHVPEATVKVKTINSISYNLPSSASSTFPKLFASLEENRSQLNIDSIGIGISTLEEVFLKLCSDVEPATDTEETTPCPIPDRGSSITSMNGSTSAPSYDPDIYFRTLQGETYRKLTGAPLYWRQLLILLKRQVNFIMYRKWVFLIMQVIMPISLIFIVTSHLNNDSKETNAARALELDLDMYDDMPDRRVLYDINVNENDKFVLRNMNNMFPGVLFDNAGRDVEDTILRIGKSNLLDYNKYLVGFELNNTDAKALYTTTVRHAAPVALNLLSNLLAMESLNSPTTQIYTRIDPMQGIVRETVPNAAPKPFQLLVTWALFSTFFIQAATLHCISLPCRERVTGSRHIHVMSGCPPELYWAATLLFHATVTFLSLILPTVIAAAIFEQDHTIDQADFLFVIMTLLFVGCTALFAMMYVISFNFNERTTSIILVASLFVFGLFFPITQVTYELIEKKKDLFYYIVDAFSYIAPPYSMSVAMFSVVEMSRVNALCNVLKEQCPNIKPDPLEAWNEDDAANCCRGEKPKCYLCPSGDLFQPLIILAVQTVVFMIIVVLTERGIFNWAWERVRNFRYTSSPAPDRSELVRAERTYVEHEIAKHPSEIKKDALLINNVHKSYASWFTKFTAVNGASFSVKKGECFGLLGVNGAGKSTTFKMLTAEECPTRGNIYGNGYHLKRGNTKYLQTLGYCPQFFGLDRFLTGTQNLSLLLTLRGLEEQVVKKEVKGWIELVGLQRYAERPVAGYSGGCVRRMGCAAALCGGAATTLLDEPSAGVDVGARRRLWGALRAGLRARRSVLLASHSMDEMEALCDRIAILSAGRVRALGSPAALRAAHAQGHAVVLKIRPVMASADQVDSPDKKLLQLKEKVHNMFACELKDAHKTMLHYHINENLRYSELFGALEDLRAQFPNLIEDYAVTETTLEEVFLSFARENKEEDECEC